MIEIFLSSVVDYLSDEFNEENKSFKNLVEWYFKLSKATVGIVNESARENLLELREIKKSYQQGKPFAKNLTKGQKKGFNYRYGYMIESMLKRGNVEEATEYAKNHLDWVKKAHSERTYYRHKKDIRALGIEI